MLFNKMVVPVCTLILSSTMLEAGIASQTLQNQLDTDRVQFEQDLAGFLAGNDVVALDKIEVPRPSTFDDYVKNEDRLLELGKALFWDQQVSTDGIMACATCHNAAGADNRAVNSISFAQQLKNQDGSGVEKSLLTFDNDTNTSRGFGPNEHLRASEFPRNLKADVLDFKSSFIRETNTIVSSAGVHFSKVSDDEQFTFVELDPKDFKLPFSPLSSNINLEDTFCPEENHLLLNIDSDTELSEVNTRRVRGRHVPTVINAVFNHRQLWNGLASNIFNGVTPFGSEDTRAKVFVINSAGELEEIKVEIDNASLASQSTGSPNNPFEMAATGVGIGAPTGHNTFIKNLDRRNLLRKRPLAKQRVSTNDSVLGNLARKHGKGLRVRNYQKMIKKAFKNKWWKSHEDIIINEDGTRTIVRNDYWDSDADTFKQIQMNFPLFFGLALYKYESTLVADQTPVDRYLNGDHTALSDSELIGFRLAANEARCINCHGGGEFTFASVSRINKQGLTRDRRGDLIDEGFNNIGVTPTLDDLGVGGLGPKVNDGKAIELSFARKELLAGNTENKDLDLGSDGAMKIPTLRNTELTAPYFHNGGEATLSDVVDFYFRGGNYRSDDLENKHPVIGFSADRTQESKITGLGILTGPNKDSAAGLNTDESGGLDNEDRDNIVAFLKALTDERVRYSQAPFDHPSLRIPVGHVGDSETITKKKRGVAKDIFFRLKQVGANGSPYPRETFFEKLY